MSAIAPAPTAWTDAAAPPENVRKTISIAIFVETAAKALKSTKRLKETIYIVLLPLVSEKLDQNSGKIPMESM